MPVFGKVLEKILYRRFIGFLIKYDVLSKEQFGFQSKKSTIDAVMEVVEYSRNNMNIQEPTCCAFIDLTKAFDTVNLSSVLGPLLFLIYINDLPSVCNDNKVTLFADDANIYGSLKNGNENYKNCLTRVFEWMTANKLTINDEKSSLMMTNEKNTCDHLEILNHKLKISESLKYLGVYLDNQLNFKEHIKQVKIKLTQVSAAMFQFKKIFRRPTLVKLYKTYVQPIVQYVVLVYGCGNKTDLKKIDWAQNGILRLIFSLKKGVDLSEIRQNFKIFSVFELHVYELLKQLVKNISMSEAKNLKTRIISDNELNAVLSTEHRIKKLKTINKNTTHVRKSITERVRNLFNIIARLDFSFIQEIVNLKQKERNVSYICFEIIIFY